MLTGSSGSIASRFSYDAYGRTLNSELLPAEAGGTLNPSATLLLYAGEQFDSDLQHYYLRARYYDPANGRFNRLDRFVCNKFNPQSLHAYAYIHGDPVNGADPSGYVLLSFVTGFGVTSVLAAAPTPGLGGGDRQKDDTDVVDPARAHWSTTASCGLWRLQGYSSQENCIERVGHFCDKAREWEKKNGVGWTGVAVACGSKYALEFSGVPGEYDKWKHCRVGCGVARDEQCGKEMAEYLAWQNECIDASDFVKGSVADDDDVKATIDGANAPIGTDCKTYCDSKHAHP